MACLFRLRYGLERQRDFHAQAAFRWRDEFELRGGAVERLEARLGVGESDAAPGGEFVGVGEANAVVGHRKEDRLRRGAGGNRDRAGRAARLEAVANRVFGERLEHERRHECGERGGFDFANYTEAVAETRLLNGKVAVEEIEFAGEGDFVVRGEEREAKEVAEIADEFIGLVGVAVDESGDRVATSTVGPLLFASSLWLKKEKS